MSYQSSGFFPLNAQGQNTYNIERATDTVTSQSDDRGINHSTNQCNVKTSLFGLSIGTLSHVIHEFISKQQVYKGYMTTFQARMHKKGSLGFQNILNTQCLQNCVKTQRLILDKEIKVEIIKKKIPVTKFYFFNIVYQILDFLFRSQLFKNVCQTDVFNARCTFILSRTLLKKNRQTQKY